MNDAMPETAPAAQPLAYARPGVLRASTVSRGIAVLSLLAGLLTAALFAAAVIAIALEQLEIYHHPALGCYADSTPRIAERVAQVCYAMGFGVMFGLTMTLIVAALRSFRRDTTDLILYRRYVIGQVLGSLLFYLVAVVGPWLQADRSMLGIALVPTFIFCAYPLFLLTYLQSNGPRLFVREESQPQDTYKYSDPFN